MLIEGFIFGMLLQLSVGPVCLYILNTAISRGLMISLVSVAGVTLADAVYISLALAGISGFVTNKKYRGYFRAFGGGVLMLIGAYMVFGVFGNETAHKMPDTVQMNGFWRYFLYAFLLTLSNPLTIVFWTGIFAVKINGKNRDKSGVYFFGLGAVLSTLAFLSLVAICGALANSYLPSAAIKILNFTAGAAIVAFGADFIRKKAS